MSPSSQNFPILSVSQLTHAIKLCLESSFSLVWIQGEVSNIKLHTSGHLYFSLKDANAQIAAVMFRKETSKMKVLPKVGDQVLVRGQLNVYPPRGNYQIIVEEMTQVGLGELLLKLEELKAKLKERGWFAPEHKKPIPKLPRHIGVVTSPTGAAIQDILNVLGRRFAGFHLVLNPVKVQGDGASQEIAQAIEQFNQHRLVDVMIVGRGGGSLEDLWAFNEEVVAAAIFKSEIPIISAVGHETDHCLADYVADVRAPTPSAAAEIVIAEKAQQERHLLQIERRLKQTTDHLIKQCRHQLSGIMKQPMLTSPYALLGASMQRLDDSKVNIASAMRQFLHHKRLQLEARKREAEALRPTTQILHFRQKLRYWDNTLKTSWFHILNAHKERLKGLTETLHAIDPKNLLTKGYGILFAQKDRSVITSVHAIKPQDEIQVLLSDGELQATVKHTFPK